MYFEWLCSHYVPYHYSSITTILFPPKPPPKPLILVFAHTVSPEILGSCMKIGLKCTRLVNVFFIVCKSNNQHIIFCSLQLFSLLLSTHWLFSRDTSPPICNLRLKFFCRKLCIFTLSANLNGKQ